MTVYKLRIGGSNDYISAIDPTDDTCFPPGSTKCVQGISHQTPRYGGPCPAPVLLPKWWKRSRAFISP